MFPTIQHPSFCILQSSNNKSDVGHSNVYLPRYLPGGPSISQHLFQSMVYQLIRPIQPPAYLSIRSHAIPYQLPPLPSPPHPLLSLSLSLSFCLCYQNFYLHLRPHLFSPPGLSQIQNIETTLYSTNPHEKKIFTPPPDLQGSKKSRVHSENWLLLLCNVV